MIKKNQNLKENKIYSLNQDFDQKLIVIFLSKASNELEFEKLGASFYDFLKRNELSDIYINTLEYDKSKSKNLIFLNSFIHGAELKSYKFNLYKTKNQKQKLILDLIRTIFKRIKI